MNDHDFGGFDYSEAVALFQAMANPECPESMTWFPSTSEILRSDRVIRSHP